MIPDDSEARITSCMLAITFSHHFEHKTAMSENHPEPTHITYMPTSCYPARLRLVLTDPIRSDAVTTRPGCRTDRVVRGNACGERGGSPDGDRRRPLQPRAALGRVEGLDSGHGSP